jgi:hypothetical protein
MSQWYHSGVTVLLQCCYSGVTVAYLSCSISEGECLPGDGICGGGGCAWDGGGGRGVIGDRRLM